MSDPDDCILVARAELLEARRLILADLAAYPTPISGCDVQYTALLARRDAVRDALRALDAPRFFPTPRIPHEGAGVESR